MTELTALENQLAEMAEHLIKNATDETEVDVFKAVSTWHIAMKKATKGEEGDDSGSFSSIRKKLRSVT